MLLRSCQFSECQRTIHFHDTHASLPFPREEEHKRARLKIEEGVRISLEVRQRAEEEHAWLDTEEEAHPIEEARLKSEEEYQSRIRYDKEELLTNEAGKK